VTGSRTGVRCRRYEDIHERLLGKRRFPICGASSGVLPFAVSSPVHIRGPRTGRTKYISPVLMSMIRVQQRRLRSRIDVSPLGQSTRQPGSGGQVLHAGKHRVGGRRQGGITKCGICRGSCPRNLPWWFSGLRVPAPGMLESSDWEEKKWPLWSRAIEGEEYSPDRRHAVHAAPVVDQALHRAMRDSRPELSNTFQTLNC